MVAQISFVPENALTRFLQAEIDARFKSAENLAKKAGLANGTVRNVLSSGRASDKTLAALSPVVGKSRNQLAAMAGKIDADATEADPFFENLETAGRLIPESERADFARAVLALARGWRSNP